MAAMGEIAAIWLKRFKGGPMDSVAEALAVHDRGLAGNADQGGRRQVTLIDEALWAEAQEEVGVDVPPSARRANVMLRGLNLAESRGKLLRLGGCVIRILNMTRPCEQMEEAQAGLKAALGIRWRCGVYGEIVEGGVLRTGDAASWVEGSDVC
jgi:MOSC domain-containing protein YiiM